MMRSDFDLKQQNNNIGSKIVAAFERVAQAFRVLLWQESLEYALTPIQVQVLIFLLYHDSEKRKITYLAGEFNMTKATISDAIKTLLQKKLVTKDYEPHDTRSFIINLTKEGKEIARKTSLFTKKLLEPIENLHNDDQENLLLSLMDIIRHLNKADVITIQRMCNTCIHYQPPNSNKKKPFCNLLNQELQETDHRIDCPDYEMKI